MAFGATQANPLRHLTLTPTLQLFTQKPMGPLYLRSVVRQPAIAVVVDNPKHHITQATITNARLGPFLIDFILFSPPYRCSFSAAYYLSVLSNSHELPIYHSLEYC